MTLTEEFNFNGIALQLQKKNIKNLYIRILTNGTVQVSVPLFMSKSQLLELLNKKESWIKSQLQKNKAKKTKTALQYVTGEQLQIWGESCTLVAQNSSVHCSIIKLEHCLYLQAPKFASIKQKETMVNEWSRQQIKNKIPAYLEKWQPIIGVSIEQWGVKNMKTRWGTCNITDKRIWLNLQLVHYPPVCLEFVIVHELTHLLERAHNQRFYALMDAFMPDWRQADQTLKLL